MPIPDFQACFKPILMELAQRTQVTRLDLVDIIAAHFGLSEQERRELLPSGRQEVLANRVGWSTTYLKKAGLVASPRKGVVSITDEGRRLVEADPPTINVRYLKDIYPGFRGFMTRSRLHEASTAETQDDQDEPLTPEEQFEQNYAAMRAALTAELLERMLTCSPTFFERLVVRVMVAMGYGGTLKDAGEAIGRSGDEGVDGVIKEDRLGLDLIYLQAKRWAPDRTVGRPELQKFVGALDGKRAHKGVFITTSSFTTDALDYAGITSRRLILIDGQRLAGLMIDHGVGVAPFATYDLKRVDSDFFNDE